MDNRTFERWATVELFGKEGENYEQVIARISLELLPASNPLEDWSFVPLDINAIRNEQQPPPPPPFAAPRYVWKDPAVKNRKRKPRTNVSRETSRSVSVVAPRVKRIHSEWLWNDGTPIVVNREEIKALTERQKARAMEILLGKE